MGEWASPDFIRKWFRQKETAKNSVRGPVFRETINY